MSLTFSSLFIFSILSFTTQAFTYYSPEKFPDSITQPELCGNSKPSFLCDPNGVLDNSTRKDLIHFLEEVQYKTICSCAKTHNKYGKCDSNEKGSIFLIGIVPSIILNSEPRTNKYILKAAEQFAETVRRRQQRGHCQDDIFILYSSNDDVVYTTVGAAAGKLLTQKVISDISNDANDLLREGRFLKGFKLMINNYVRVLNSENAELEQKPFYSNLPEWAYITFAIISRLAIALIIIVSILALKIYFCDYRKTKLNYKSGSKVRDSR